MSDLTVVVATHGSTSWADLARERAIPSAETQAPVAHVHGETLADARNRGLEQVGSEWVVFLDADDELEPGYVEAMVAGAGDLRVPRVRYIRHGRAMEPRFPHVVGHEHECTADCLPDGNWIVIGAAVRADLVRSVGGFRPWPWCEDWDVWCRCWRAGAVIERAPGAVYRAHVREHSRNRQGTPKALRQATFNEIRRANFPSRTAVG